MATVADVMTKDVATVTPTTPVRDVARLLYTRNLSGVPVVDEGEQQLLVGIVSEGDLMGHVAAVGEQPRRHRSGWRHSPTARRWRTTTPSRTVKPPRT